jgi:phosphatidylserine/phosphatidylglycerophosphate/cardiolipin synthase-like enzyme
VTRALAWAMAAVALAVCAPAQARSPGDLAHVAVAFTPGDDIASLIAGHIAAARRSVRMQAYLFTDPRIARALFAARRRGVDVVVIGDAAQQADGGLPWLAPLARAGAHVYLDGAFAAAHEKIVIVDGERPDAAIITGSYNFTRSAQARNAENVVVISGNRAIAGRFMRNFEAHREEAKPWP